MRWIFKPVAAAIGLNIGRSAAQLAEERINAMDVSSAQRCRGEGVPVAEKARLRGKLRGWISVLYFQDRNAICSACDCLEAALRRISLKKHLDVLEDFCHNYRRFLPV